MAAAGRQCREARCDKNPIKSPPGDHCCLQGPHSHTAALLGPKRMQGKEPHHGHHAGGQATHLAAGANDGAEEKLQARDSRGAPGGSHFPSCSTIVFCPWSPNSIQYSVVPGSSSLYAFSPSRGHLLPTSHPRGQHQSPDPQRELLRPGPRD